MGVSYEPYIRREGCVIGKRGCDAVRHLRGAGRGLETEEFGQNLARPPVDVVRLHDMPHPAHALLALLGTHQNCCVHRSGDLVRSKRIDEQSARQLARSACEATENEYAILVE